MIANCSAPLIFISAYHLPPHMQFNRISKLIAALRLLRLLQLLAWTDRYQRLAYALTNGSGGIQHTSTSELPVEMSGRIERQKETH